MDCSAYITCEANGYDFDIAPSLGRLHRVEDAIVPYVFTSSFSAENRESFSGSDVSVCMEIDRPNEDALSEGLDYSVDIPEALNDTEGIDEVLYDYIVSWLNNKASALS